MEFYSPATPPSPKASRRVLIAYVKFTGFVDVMAGYWIPKDNYTKGTFKYITTGNIPTWKEMEIERMVGWAYLPKAPDVVNIKKED